MFISASLQYVLSLGSKPREEVKLHSKHRKQKLVNFSISPFSPIFNLLQGAHLGNHQVKMYILIYTNTGGSHRKCCYSYTSHQMELNSASDTEEATSVRENELQEG